MASGNLIMTSWLAGPVLYILEVASLAPQHTSAQLRAQLETAGIPLRIVGELSGYPGVVIEADELTAAKLHDLLPAEYGPFEIVELRQHFCSSDLSDGRLTTLVTECYRTRRLAVGSSAVERAIQRRRVELLVLADDIADPYAMTIRAIIKSTGYQGSVGCCWPDS